MSLSSRGILRATAWRIIESLYMGYGFITVFANHVLRI